MESRKLSFIQSLKCGFASLVSTCISISLVHPLQVVKVRFQSTQFLNKGHDGQANQHNIVPKYGGVFNALKQIFIDEGFKGLYKGLSITVLNAAISSFLFFSFYETLKKSLLLKKDPSRKHEVQEILFASVQSGIGVVCITQPMWVIRTRMLLNTKKRINQKSNLFFTVKQIKQQHGFKGYYKGLSMNLLLSSNRALQMLAYEVSQSFYDKFNIPQSVLMEKNFLCGGFSKVANVFLIYPLTTIRTRIIQNQFVKSNPNSPKYKNVMETVIRTFQIQGISGFYKGMKANLLRGIPQRAIFFYSYQLTKNALFKKEKKY